MDSRKKAALALLLLGGGCLAGLGALVWRGSGSTAVRERARFPRAELAQAPESGAPDKTAPEQDDAEFSFGDFLDVLGVESMRPEVKAVASQFAKEFMAEPALRDVYREFANDRLAGRKRGAHDFLNRLGKIPEFHRLEAKFASSEATTAAVLALYESAALGRFWKRQEKDPADNPLIARIKRLAKSLSVRFHDPVRKAGPQALSGGVRAPGSFASGGPGAGYGSAGAPAGTVGAEAGAIDGGGAPAAPVAGGSGPNAHDINAKLGTIGAAESDPMAIFCSPEKFKWLCDFLGAGERQSMYGSIGRDGLWGACWSLRLVDKCLAACGASGGRCSAKSAWDACLEARDGGELACVQECQTSPYTQWCTVPDDVIQRLCLVAWPGPKPSECGGLGGVRPRPGGGTTGGTTGGASGGCAPEGSQCTCSITRQCFDGTEYTWKSCMADNCHIEVWAEDPCKCTGGDSCNPCN